MWRYLIALNLLLVLWGAVVIFGLPVTLGVVGTLITLVTLVGLLLIERLQANKGAKLLENALGAQADDLAGQVRPDQEADIAEMRAQFLNELGTLKGSRLAGGGKAALYALPWYIIIGPPGAGKSTALRNSGLSFPSRQSGVRGIGGTRNCDWWFTNEAVILDTAGRYATEEEDREEWLAFLEIIRKHRKRKPINGLIAAVSVTDLAGESEGHVAKLAKRIRQRMDEVTTRLQMRVPIYLLFTKCDLIPGFVESFGGLRKNERGQIWGTTFRLDHPPDRAEELFGERFDELSKVVWRRMHAALENERRTETRERMYQFPQQLDLLRANLSHFTGQLFSSSIYDEPPIMRGVYFSSGTQEGRPVDLLRASMAEAFGMAPEQSAAAAAIESKSYFLRDLFAKVLFPDQQLAVRASSGRRALLLRRLAIGGGAFITAALLTVLPLQAFRQNVAVVSSTEEIIREVVEDRQKNENQVISATLLSTLRERLSDIKQWEADAPPLAMRYGMYQGDVLAQPVRDFYVQTLQRELLHPIIQYDVELMQTLRHVYGGFNAQPSEQEYARYFEKLKLHLLLTGPRARGEPEVGEAEAAWIVHAVTGRWIAARGQNAQPAARAEMEQHIRFYLDLLRGNPALALPRDEGAVRDTRNMLNRVPYADAVVKRLIASAAEHDRDLNVRRIVAGAVTPLVSDLNVAVRAAFTHWGWETMVRERLAETSKQSDQWVFGASNGGQPLDTDRLHAELRSAYFGQYIAEWREFIDSLRVRQAADMTDSLKMLQELTRGQPPPLVRLFQAVGFNTRLTEKQLPAAATTAAAAGGKFLTKVAKKLTKGKAEGVSGPAGGAARSLLGPPVYSGLRQASDVRDEFRSFVQFGYIEPPPGGAAGDAAPQPASTAADVLNEELAALRNALQGYLDDPGQGEALVSRLGQARSTARALLGSMELGSGWRPRIESLVWPPIESVSENLVSLRNGTGRDWCSEVVMPYVRHLKGRFPMADRDAEATIADVAEFFRPESGILWGFYSSTLKPDIVQTGRRFGFRKQLGGIVERSYRASVLDYLQKALRFSQELFPPGSDRPTIELDLLIVPSPVFGTIALDIGGERLEYRGGPETWQRLVWPAGDPAKGAALHMTGRGGVEDTLRFDGEWGFFRLLATGSVVAAAGSSYRVRWNSRRFRQPVTIELRPVRGRSALIRMTRQGTRRAVKLALGDMTPPFNIARGGAPCQP